MDGKPVFVTLRNGTGYSIYEGFQWRRLSGEGKGATFRISFYFIIYWIHNQPYACYGIRLSSKPLLASKKFIVFRNLLRDNYIWLFRNLNNYYFKNGWVWLLIIKTNDCELILIFNFLHGQIILLKI